MGVAWWGETRFCICVIVNGLAALKLIGLKRVACIPERLASVRGGFICAYLGVLCRCLQCLEILSIPTEISLSLWCLSLILLLRHARNIIWDKFLAGFCVIALVSILFMKGEDVTGSLLRYCGFVIGLLLLSPLISNRVLNHLRRKLWHLSIHLLRMIVVVSACQLSWKYVGVYVLKSISYDMLEMNRGIVTQGMLLSPLSAIVAIDSFSKICNTSHRISGNIGMVLLWGAGWLCTIIGGSRIATLGCLTAHVWIICSYGKERNIYPWVWAALCGMVVLVLSSWSIIGQTIDFKNNLAYERGSVISSRVKLWSQRMDEIKENPLIGIGFDAPTERESGGWIHYDVINLKAAEPGSSWLWIVATTGVVGSICFMAFIVGMIKKLVRVKRYSNRLYESGVYLISFFIFFLINGIAEGWVTYAGSLMFMMFWLLCGNISASDVLGRGQHGLGDAS